MGLVYNAGVFADSHQCDKLERLCRYIARPALSKRRLSLTSTGKVRYELKTPYANGTTHVFFSPIDFISKLAALVPPLNESIQTTSINDYVIQRDFDFGA
ncbi:MAG: transposase [Pseudomonadota bacterium]